MAGIPTAVQKQGDAAKDLQGKIAEGIPVTVIDDEAEGKDQPKDQVIETPAQTLEQGKEPQPAQKPKDYEHSFKVLRGKYNKEVGDLRSELEEARSLLSQANATISNLNDIIVAQQKQPSGVDVDTEEDEGAKPKVIPTKELKKEDFQAYGEEMTDMVDTVNALLKENQELKAKYGEVGTQVKSIGETVEKDASERFYDVLTKKVKKWRSINKDPRWHNYLAQIDAGTGIQRQRLLDDAHQKGDVARVAHWFNSFIKETGYQPEGGGDEITPSLEDEITPDETGGGGAIQPEDETVTRAQFQKASKDYIDKRITKEEFDKISLAFQRSIKKGKV